MKRNMKNLSVWLPPFAGDYAGACAMLFDFNCLIILADAACCTRNYIEYDEPRRTCGKQKVFSAQLRTLEVTLGDETRVLRQAREPAMRLQPDFIALLGSPVPALVGMDMQGMAAELESETGMPVLGIDTSGFSFYDQGASLALCQLIRRFSHKTATIPGSVNLLGLAPLDFGAGENAMLIRAALKQRGFHVLFSGAMGTDMRELENAANANCNIVVSHSGLAAALEMKRRFGIPYTCSLPIGNADVFAEKMRHGFKYEASVFGERQPILIVSEQILGCSLRDALRRHGCKRPIQLATFFGMDASMAQETDCALAGEALLVRMLEDGNYRAVIGDPLLQSLPCMDGMTFFPFAHPAVSGSLHWNEVPLFLGAKMEHFLKEVASL